MHKRIVIIGAGYGGISCAMTLAKLLKPADRTKVVILEKSKYLFNTMATPRSYVDASFDPKLFVPYDKTIEKDAAEYVRLVRGVATSISGAANEVSYRAIDDSDDKAIDKEETLPFDYLVMATGSAHVVPIKQDEHDYSRATTEAKLQEVREQIDGAGRILVVGGGFVGCEVAGEIASKYPNKSVTLLESKPKLVSKDRVSDKFRETLVRSLEKLNIKIITGERLSERMNGNSFEKRVVTTTKGTEIESDIQLICGGYRPVGDLVKQMDASLINDRGEIKVNPQLQLESDQFRNIFVLGDANNHGTCKSAEGAHSQGSFLAEELVSVLRQKQDGFTKAYPPDEQDKLMLSLGPDRGVSHLTLWGGVVLGDFFTRMFKSRDMYTSMSWGMLKAQPPP